MENISNSDFIFVGLLIIHLLFLVIVLSNFFYLSKAHSIAINKKHQPKLDILIPARNEEQNIKKAINSILQSDYKNYKIIVLDDNSSDKTKGIVEELIIRNNNIELINGKPLPDNWIGKNWACYQLSNQAEAKYILFLDADVTLNPKAISFAISIMQNKETDLLSFFPSQKIKSFGEHLVVPIMDWMLLTFLPLSKVYYSKYKSLSAANGQFMLFKTNAYKQFGGHENIKTKIVEDVEFARGFKLLNKRVVTLTGNKLVECRMYNGFYESINGFTKNFYSGINTNPLAFTLLLLTNFFVFVFPFVGLFYSILALPVVLIILSQRFISSVISKQNLFVNLILFPLQMIVLIYIAIRSLILTKRKYLVWKERKIT